MLWRVLGIENVPNWIVVLPPVPSSSKADSRGGCKTCFECLPPTYAVVSYEKWGTTFYLRFLLWFNPPHKQFRFPLLGDFRRARSILQEKNISLNLSLLI